MPKTPLHTAAQTGNLQQVTNLLRDGAAVTCWDKVRRYLSSWPILAGGGRQVSLSFVLFGAGRLDTLAPRLPPQSSGRRTRAGPARC